MLTTCKIDQSFDYQKENLELNFTILKNDKSAAWHDFYQKNSSLLHNIGFSSFFDQLEKIQSLTYQINIIFCNNNTIQHLNNNYREINKPTNVLSFPTYDRQELKDKNYTYGDHQCLGDIFIAYDYCYQEVLEMQIPFENHIAHMLAHGILHIFGYDHIIAKEAEEMEALEIKILHTAHIESPYQLQEKL